MDSGKPFRSCSASSSCDSGRPGAVCLNDELSRDVVGPAPSSVPLDCVVASSVFCSSVSRPAAPIEEVFQASSGSRLPIPEDGLCRASISLSQPGCVNPASTLSCGVSFPSADVEGPVDGSVLPSTTAISRPLKGILPLPCSSAPCSLVRPRASVYPVNSTQQGQTVGPSAVFSVVPMVPEPVRLREFSNFDLSDKSFPPLTSQSFAKADPPSSPSPQSYPDRPCGASDGPTIAPPSWASLVKAAPSNLLLKFIKPDSVDCEGKLKVKLPPAIPSKGASVWKNTLVGFFLDKLPISLVQASANRLWGNLGLTDVLCNGNGFFFFKFSEPGCMNVVLEGGPWYFGGRPIFLKLWVPGMNLSKEGCRCVPIWAHFYNVPLELWTDEGLSFIASTIGKPLHADSSTSSFKRLNFARICIEINVDDPLPNAFDIESEDGSCVEIQIVYNWVPKKCSVCKFFGHLSKNCKKASNLRWIPKSAQPHVSSSGEWQMVNSLGKVGLDKRSSSPTPPALLPLPAKALSQPIIHSGGLLCSLNTFDSLPSEDVPPAAATADSLPSADSSGCADFPSEASPPITAVSEDPAAPLFCSSVRQDWSSPLSDLPSPSSSPSSSPSASSLLANKLIMVDEVEKILGKKMKDKKKNRSSGNSRGQFSKPSK